MSSERTVATATSSPSASNASSQPTDADRSATDRTLQTIRRHAAEIERAELERAFNRLEAKGDIDPEEAQVITEMADRIVAELVSRWEGIESEEEHSVRGLRELFDLD